MKQLLIVGTSAYGTNSTEGNAGVITMRKLSDQSILSAKAEENFSISLGRGDNLVPFIIPEVDINTLKVTKAVPSAGSVFQAQFVCPAISANQNRNQSLTLLINKKGTVFNERNSWSFVVPVKKGATMTAANVASQFVDLINAAQEKLNLKAEVVSSTNVKLTGPDKKSDYAVQFTDDLVITPLVEATSVSAGKYVTAVPAKGDADYVRDLSQRCIAGKGVKYLGEDGKEIYGAGYPEKVIEGDYFVYTLRFAVGRDSAKQRDERVWQLVHIAVPTDGASVTTIETVLGIDSVSGQSIDDNE